MAGLEIVPSGDEIKQAVWDLDPVSSPGPDGFPAWQIKHGNSLMSVFFRARFLKIDGSLKTTYLSSSIWPGLKKVWWWVQSHEQWTVGNGQRINFWKDSWLGKKSIEEMYGLQLDIFDSMQAKVSDFICQEEWNFPQFVSIDLILQELFAGSTESSIVSVEWALSALLKNPEIFKRATEELDRVVGRERWVQEKDISNLPYIDGIVKETMRMYPVSPLLTPHQAQEDCEVAGYTILAGTRVHVSQWTIGRDPMLWDAPQEFRPERFIGKTIDIKGRDFELLPFGSGRRMCPGYVLGLKMIQSYLANLIHGFLWELPGEMQPKDLNMDELYGLSSPKKMPLIAVAEPRLPAHLYCG
ncbi:trimethyltridecatetraene synthase-like [Macadamia integrifolia]|uniref:trimethyltridecatetraene synthase-like n=1 Tax=Macadamia integrifolia TaxID=60698 RepID=UPI001C4E762D|nr:trimethyltridecatetraene synthase-like [Macadamia integrifolia]